MSNKSADKADAAAAKPARRLSWRPRALLGGPILLALLAYFAAGYWRTTAPTPIAPTSPSLVILPVRPAGNAPDEALLAEALTSQLTTRLARTQGLRLIWATSARRAQAEKLGLQVLGERLHVTHALQGSLRQTDRQLHIELHRNHLADGRTLCLQTYDRELGEMAAVEREIAQA